MAANSITRGMTTRTVLSWPEALERIAQLETLCGLNWQAPIDFRLTPIEHSFMGLLMRAPGVLDRERAFDLLYFDRADTMAGAKGLDTLVCKLRAKLRPFGVEITTSHGRGWYISSEAKRAINARLAEQFAIAAKQQQGELA